MTQAKILVVDDVLANRDLLRYLLVDDFEVECVDSGQACIDTMAAFEPKVVLMDVKMPEMNGYVTCEKIKAERPELSVIFVSAYTTLEDRISGYEAGGDDYLGKPFDEQELRFKIDLALNNQEARRVLSDQLASVTSLAHSVMTNTSELGVVMRFMEASAHCKTLAALATCLFEATDTLGLSAVIRTQSEHGTTHHISEGVVTPLLEELFERAQKQSRIFSFEAKTFYTYPNLILLIKNMPVADEDKYGRYKDHLALLASGGSAAAKAIAISEALQAQDGVKAVIAETCEAINRVASIIRKQSTQTSVITETLGQDIEATLLVLGLEEDQELRLITMIDDATTSLLKNLDSSQAITQAFSDILCSLEKLSH